MKLISFFRITLILFLFLLNPCLTLAANTTKKTYQFEMLVFSALTPQTLTSEQWPVMTPSTIHLSNQGDASYQSFLQQINFKQSTASDLDLNLIEKRIQTNPHFRIIAHLAWQERVPTSRHSIPIRIYGGNAYADDGSTVAYDDAQEVPMNTYPHWQMNGEVNLSLNRYFNTRFNLLFAEPTAAISSELPLNNLAPTPFTYFHLLQTRRTKSNELNYIDNPLYRILFVIKKVPEPHQT